MMFARRVHYTYEEYLRALEDSEIKLEYCEGEIFAMAGGTLTHAKLSARMISTLDQALGERCSVLSSDAKIRVEQTDLSTFPDVTVVCGAIVTSARDAHAVINPTLIVEVTSPSTEQYDRGAKLTHYQHLESLRAVIFVSHARKEIEVVSRDAERWSTRIFSAGEEVVVSAPAVRFSIDTVYAGLDLA